MKVNPGKIWNHEKLVLGNPDRDKRNRKML